MAKKPPAPQHNPDAILVDKLLRDLQGPDAQPSAKRQSGQIKGPLVGRAHYADPVAGPVQRWGTWGRVWLVLALGVGLTQWPYANQCGWPLLFYMVSILVATSAGVWAAAQSWKWRMAAAHMAAVILIFWSLFLVGELLLPRVGYAKVDATWRCVMESTVGR
jgi:hypothetical protein